MIEEIQLEPIPEYLSNQRVDKKKKADNSMLLLDEDQVFEKDLPKKDVIKGKHKDQLLSEIAEEDDISSVSESVRNPYGLGLGSNGKNGHSTFGPGGKSSVTSVKSVQSTSKLSASHTHKQSFTNGGDLIDKKRRSEIM